MDTGCNYDIKGKNSVSYDNLLIISNLPWSVIVWQYGCLMIIVIDVKTSSAEIDKICLNFRNKTSYKQAQ